MVAQVLLIREFLVNISSNELTVGFILANWVIIGAIGAFVTGRISDRVKNNINLFIILLLIFSLLLPFTVYFVRIFKLLAGVPLGRGVGFSSIFIFSFLFLFPLRFIHGGMFSSGCKAFHLHGGISGEKSMGVIYAWENAGTVAGGFLITYVFFPDLNSFQTVFILSILIVLSTFILSLLKKNSRFLTSISGLLFIFFSFFMISGYTEKLQDTSLDERWRGINLVTYKNSAYNNITVTKKGTQYTFYINGMPLVTLPHPDKIFVEEFGNLPLLFHPDPDTIALLSTGPGGIINQIIKNKIDRLYYMEIDPLIIKMFKKYSTPLTRKELSSNLLDTRNIDGRLFIRKTKKKFDVIIIGLSEPSTLEANRYFTKEFFRKTKEKLQTDGILAFRLPGSPSYSIEELRKLNTCIKKGLEDVYKYTLVIPGNYNLYLASSSNNLRKITPEILFERIQKREIKTTMLTLPYLKYRLNPEQRKWFLENIEGATEKINRDFMPFAVFQYFTFWSMKFTPELKGLTERLEDINLKFLIISIALITSLLIVLNLTLKNFSPAIPCSIFTTGFFSMLGNLVLILSFQIIYGSMYFEIGLLITASMMGMVAGSTLLNWKLDEIKNGIKKFILLEFLIMVTAILIPVLLNFLNTYGLKFTLIEPRPVLYFLLIVSGFLVGCEFPLAGKIRLKKKDENVGGTSGLIYSADLAGGWLAGIFGSVIFLPLLGLFRTFLIIILLKTGSLIILLISNRRQ